MNSRRLPAALLALCFIAGLPRPGLALDLDVVPPAALKAEMEQRWDDALRVYADIIRAWPDRVDIWLRIADVHAAKGDAAAAADAVGQVAALLPEDAAMQARWSQALAVANRPGRALLAINRAVELEPGNADYLAAQAQLALWNGRGQDAADAYRRWLRLSPGDPNALRDWARLVARLGQLERAVAMYEACLRAPGADPAVRLELANVHGYRGDFGSARDELRRYRESEGSDPEQYLRARATLESRAGNPRRALELLEPLLAKYPDDYELRLARATALQQDQDAAGALAAIGELERLGPARPETAGTRLQVETPLRHTVGARASYYSDSLELSQVRYLAFGGLQTGPRLRWTLEAERIDTRVTAGSAFAAPDGSHELEVDRVNLGLRYRVNPVLALDAGGGAFAPQDGDDVAAYQAGLELRPVDGLRMRLGVQRDLLLVSPRAIALGIDRQRASLSANSRFGDWFFLDLEANRDRYRDDNRSVELVLGPRVAVVRNQYLNLDLGARGHWLRYDAPPDPPPDRGYYAPEDFRRYWGTAFLYGKLLDDAGIGVAAGYGVEKDAALDSGYRPAGDLSVEGVFGVFSDWQLRLWGAAGGRVDSAGFQDGAYNGRTVGVELLRRF